MDLTGWLQVALGVGAILVAISIFWRERHSKTIWYSVITNTSLVTSSRFAIQVAHNGLALAEPRLIVVRMSNAGGLPIVPQDYEAPLRMEIEGVKIVSAEVTMARPSSLDLAVDASSGSAVQFETKLLNPRDVVEVQCLVDGIPKAVRIRGRIAGVREVLHVDVQRDSWGRAWKVGVFDATVQVLISVVLVWLGIYVALGVSGLARVLAFLPICGAVWIWLFTWRATKKSRLLL